MAGPVCLAPDGVWRAAVSPRRWWALTPPFHPYLRRLRRCVAGGFLSVPLSVGFRRLSQESVLPCGVRTFLERANAPAVTRPASSIVRPFRRRRSCRAASCRTRGRRRERRRAGRTPRTPGTRARPRATARRAPVRASGAGAQCSCEIPEHPHDLAQDLDVLGIDRLELTVLRLEPDPAFLLVERLDGR